MVPSRDSSTNTLSLRGSIRSLSTFAEHYCQDSALDVNDYSRSNGNMKVPAPAMAVSAMLSVQTGAALSTHLFNALTPAGSAWLRLAIAAIILLLITRPRLRAIGWPALRGTLLLGAVTAVMTLAYIEAIARIPLG